MTPIELMADFVSRNCDILKLTVSDFSEEDMRARPVPGANCAAWQVGHLVGGLAHMVGMTAPGVIPQPLAELGGKFSGKTAHIDDPSYFPSKGQLLEAFAAAHGAFIEWVRSLSAADLNKPMPAKMADFAPTVGHLVLMTATHISMHLGQIQVIRRKLGKPLLF